MIELIETQIGNINKSIEWIRKYKNEQFEQKYISLVEERRKLRIMAILVLLLLVKVRLVNLIL